MTTSDIATAEEIDRRIEAADTARRAKRSAAAQEIGELARRRAVLAEQLDEVERQLGAVLAESSDVLDIDELARFTNIPAAELTGWLTARKPARAKRKKPPTGESGTTSCGPSIAGTPPNVKASAPPKTGPRTEAVNAPERATAGVP
ncbi:hypothetical protein [Amycolatopsis sp. NPDC059657]|uniref:hypothetical protein n=1 Tax=Amycolatopsis sp. NPDC059657 TaxID=3346899 RepID=UPI00366AE6AB